MLRPRCLIDRLFEEAGLQTQRIEARPGFGERPGGLVHADVFRARPLRELPESSILEFERGERLSAPISK